MDQLTLDKSDWVILTNGDGISYRVASAGLRAIIAHSVSLSVATQIVDEHAVALNIYALMAHFPDQMSDTDGTAFIRAFRPPKVA